MEKLHGFAAVQLQNIIKCNLQNELLLKNLLKKNEPKTW